VLGAFVNCGPQFVVYHEPKPVSFRTVPDHLWFFCEMAAFKMRCWKSPRNIWDRLVPVQNDSLSHLLWLQALAPHHTPGFILLFSNSFLNE